MLQIKNTLGGGKPEGLYVWKKSVGTGVVKETPSTERYYFTTSQSESVTIYYSSSYTYDGGDFVLTNPSEINIALGAYNAIESNLYFMVNTSRGNVMLKSSSGSNNQRTVIYNQKSGLFAHCPDSSYPFYICNDTYEFLDYIVSDKETAYPDGGEKGGYWYERVSDVKVIEEFLTCGYYSKVAIDEYIPTSDSASITVSHSLGAKPEGVICLLNDTVEDGTCVSVMASFGYNDYSLYQPFSFYYGSKLQGSYNYAKTRNSSRITLQANDTGKFKAGKKYKVVTMV